MSARRRRWVALGLALVACVLLGARVAWVNLTAFRVPETRYTVGDWVPIDGAFHYSFQENTAGYSVRVREVEKMSVAEYLDAYGVGGVSDAGGYPGTTSLVVLTMDVRNEGNDGGGIYLNQCRLLSCAGASYYYQDPELWALSEPSLYESGVPALSLSIAPDTEYVVHVPYVLAAMDAGERYSHPIRSGNYELVLSWSPDIKVVDIVL